MAVPFGAFFHPDYNNPDYGWVCVWVTQDGKRTAKPLDYVKRSFSGIPATVKEPKPGQIVLIRGVIDRIGDRHTTGPTAFVRVNSSSVTYHEFEVHFDSIICED